MSTARLVDELWGEAPPPKVLTALQAYVAKLRRQVEPDRGPGVPPSVLVTRPSGYALVLPAGAVDADRFEELLARAAAEAREAERRLDEAVRLWQGTPYAGLHEVPALAAEAQRLEGLRLGAVEQLWSLRLDRGAHRDAASALAALVVEHPVRERLWALLTLALYRDGRQAEALDALRRVRTHLADDLGIDPGPELRRLETAVLRQDDALLGPPRRPEPPARPGPSAAEASCRGGSTSWTAWTSSSPRPPRAAGAWCWSPASPASARPGWPGH